MITGLSKFWGFMQQFAWIAFPYMLRDLHRLVPGLNCPIRMRRNFEIIVSWLDVASLDLIELSQQRSCSGIDLRIWSSVRAGIEQ